MGKSCQIVHKHFEQTGHGLINCRVIPIEKIDPTPLRQQNLNEEQVNQATTKLRQEREKFWIKTLQSAYPFGLNSRVKGVGDFIPSQGNYLNFGGRKRIKKKHSKRKPKRLRNQVECSLRFIERKHRELANTHNYVHYFKTFLYNLPRLKIDKLLQEVKQDQNLEERIKDMVIMIANLRLFRPVEVTQKKQREFFHLNFRDKGLDFINISGILRNEKVKRKIPVYFEDKEPPIIGYKYNKSIAGKLFNYKQTLTEETINSFEAGDITCDCQVSRFKDDNHDHVIAGNFDIIENEKLRNIIRKGPKYRLPQKINWIEDRNILIAFLDTYMDKWIAKENKRIPGQVNIQCLNDWKEQVLQIIDQKIEKGKLRFRRTWSTRIEGPLKIELDRLKEKYVITVTDKAQNNILFTCKYFYIKKVKDELNRVGQETYQLSNIDLATINNNIMRYSHSKGIRVQENMKDVPIIYWIPKMHKHPIGSRFIAGSKFCSIKPLSKYFSKALKLILNHMKLYNNVVYERTQLNQFWILENSLEFLDKIKSKRIYHMETYDFSTLYTALPHVEIKQKLANIFKKVFKREAKPYLNVSFSKAFFSASLNRNGCSFRLEDMIEILEFILDNIFVKFGKDIHKQVIGIPIGLDSGQDIANLLLFSYESEYIENLSKNDLGLARKFDLCARYIDDLFVGNFPEFKDHIYRIYPRELEIKLESDNNKQVSYLDLNLTSNEGILTYSVYDKRDSFSFEIVNFPYMDSCIPKKSALGVFTSQLIRYSRICSKFQDFRMRTISLINKLRSQGYQVKDLRRLSLRFFQRRSDMLGRFNINNGNDFLREIFH